MLSYELSERAADDLEAVQEWYKSQSRDLARRFYEDVVLALAVARERPMSCPLHQGRVRTVRCSQFPYRIYFVPRKTRIDVLAVYHTARHPDLWDDPNRE
jgi:plasmid stabilization system protein ParE